MTATLAVVLLVGIPWAAVSYWVSRRVTGIQDRLEVFALGFAGVGVATWAVWVASVAGGFNPPIVAVALLCVAGGIVFDARRLGSEPAHRSPGATRGVVLVAMVFGLLVAVSFVTFGLVRGDTVLTLAMTDWYKHLTVATSIAAAEQFPPPNPFLLADAEPTYYFGFHLLAALASRFASSPGDVYPSLLSLTIVIATAVPFVLYAYARPTCSERGALLVAGICLLAGFDVAVVLVDAMRAAVTSWPWSSGVDAVRELVPSTHLDYWIHHNERQFNAPYVSAAWVPQHVAGVLLALVVLRLVAPAVAERPHERRSPGLLLPALALASVPALSAYVALALAVGVTVAVGADAWTHRAGPWPPPAFRRWTPVGLSAGMLTLPVVWFLASGEGSGAGIVTAVSGSGQVTNGAFWNAALGSRWWTNLLDTPAVYALELGIVGVLATVEIVRRVRGSVAVGNADREQIVILLGILALVTFFRPPVDSPNNLYARPMLLVYLMLAPFAVRAVDRTAMREWHRTAIIVCGLGTAYAVVGILLQGLLFWGIPTALADACSWTTRETPRTATLAVHPEDYTRYIGFFCRRPLVLGDRTHARLFGGTAELFDTATRDLTVAYASTSPEEGARRFDRLEADTILVRVDQEGSAPNWMAQPCFRVGYRNQVWALAIRTPSGCSMD